MNLKKEMEEIKAKEKIIKHIKTFGLDDEIRHIIGPEDKKPVVTFTPDTKKKYLEIMKLLKPEVMDIYKESSGCTGFNAITKYEVVNEDKHITLCSSGYIIDTHSDKYNSERLLKIRFFIPYNKHYMSIWVEVPVTFFESFTYVTESLVDVHETETARNYNHKHKEIMTTRPVFNRLMTIRFYGGGVSHYATTEFEKDYMKQLLFLEVKQ